MGKETHKAFALDDVHLPTTNVLAAIFTCDSNGKNCFEKLTDKGEFTEQGQELARVLEQAREEEKAAALEARRAAAKALADAKAEQERVKRYVFSHSEFERIFS